MDWKILVYTFLIHQCYGYIQDINDTEYARMPPVFSMDLYDDCILESNGIYCLADFTLVSDNKTELMDLILDYSRIARHYNHTRLRHGVCVSKMCRQFLDDRKGEDIKTTLERCLNESYWENYKLKTRLSEPLSCNINENKRNFEIVDIVVAAIFFSIILCNIIGSVYDYRSGIDAKKNKILVCFSLKRNMNKLLNPFQHLTEDEKRLKALHGLRVLTMICSMFLHATFPLAMRPENPLFIEKIYGKLLNYIIVNGTLVVQTFFIMSGFLLAYKTEVYAAKRKITWRMIPTGIIMSYIRLTPSSALVVLFSMSWLRFCGSGPLWQMAVGEEVEHCHNYGWTHIFYINNYLDYNRCMEHTWYVAANFQLLILGYFVCVLARKPLAKKITLSILLLIGIVLPVLHTYFQNLDAVMLITPELIHNLNTNRTFNNVYKRGHTNIPCFIMGIALGYYTYHCHKKQVDTKKYKKYRFFFMATFPAFIGIMFFGIIFTKEIIVSQLIKAIYAGFIKPIFGLCICMIMFGSIFKIEPVYRHILEWDGWQIPAKLTYSAYILHMALIRAMAGIGTTVNSISYIYMLQICIGTIILSFLMTVPFWLCLEAPVIELLKLPLGKKPEKADEADNA